MARFTLFWGHYLMAFLPSLPQFLARQQTYVVWQRPRPSEP